MIIAEEADINHHCGYQLSIMRIITSKYQTSIDPNACSIAKTLFMPCISPSKHNVPVYGES